MSEVKSNADPLAHLRVLTMAQICELTTYTPQHVYRMIADGRFPAPRRFGPNRIVFPLVQFEEWFASLPVFEPGPSDPDGNASV